MSTPTGAKPVSDAALVKEIFRRVAEDLALFLDRPIEIESVQVERRVEKVAGERSIHLSFKLTVAAHGETLHGSLIVPLPDAISFACYLLMMTDAVVSAQRGQPELDRNTKDAMLEVGNVIGGSVDAALREFHPRGVNARGAGCQGVRAGAAPSFPFAGGELVVGRARARLHTYPSFEMVLMLPALREPA